MKYGSKYGKYRNVVQALKSAGLEGTLRTSMRGVPHLVIRQGSKAVSVCWFGRTRSYKIFWPYPSSSQRRVNARTPAEVVSAVRGALVAY